MHTTSTEVFVAICNVDDYDLFPIITALKIEVDYYGSCVNGYHDVLMAMIRDYIEQAVILPNEINPRVYLQFEKYLLITGEDSVTLENIASHILNMALVRACAFTDVHVDGIKMTDLPTGHSLVMYIDKDSCAV